MGAIPDRLHGLRDRSANAPPWLEPTIEQIELTGWAAEIYDERWELLWVSSELEKFLTDTGSPDIGESVTEILSNPNWQNPISARSRKASFETSLPYFLSDLGGDADEIIESLSGELREWYEERESSGRPLRAKPAPPVWSLNLELEQDGLPPVEINLMNVRLHDARGRFRGTARIYGPGMRASVLSYVARGDEGMFERMSRLVSPGRQPVAILFCDIENSTLLSRRLPSAVYFQLLSQITKAVDDAIIRHQGLVGRHAGDGVSAFFLADQINNSGPDDGISKAARSAIATAREIRSDVGDIGREISKIAELDGQIDCRVKIGLHWGSTVYMGQIVSGGRLEVTALGDEVNECARISETASGGEILASKGLVERLSAQDGISLDLQLHSMTYRLLRELRVNDKAERDAGSVPVVAIP